MELKEGMYVRTKDKKGIQYIRKITSVNETYPHKAYAGIYVDKEIHNVDGVALKNIIKASYNIIDLIEVGDYVNGELVEYIEVDSYKDYVINNGYWCKQKDIKSIVTKEQFESMSYKVGD